MICFSLKEFPSGGTSKSRQSLLGFLIRQLAFEFLLTCIFQFIQVELLRCRSCLIEIPGASLIENLIFKHDRYKNNCKQSINNFFPEQALLAL